MLFDTVLKKECMEHSTGPTRYHFHESALAVHSHNRKTGKEAHRSRARDSGCEACDKLDVDLKGR